MRKFIYFLFLGYACTVGTLIIGQKLSDKQINNSFEMSSSYQSDVPPEHANELSKPDDKGKQLTHRTTTRFIAPTDRYNTYYSTSGSSRALAALSALPTENLNPPSEDTDPNLEKKHGPSSETEGSFNPPGASAKTPAFNNRASQNLVDIKEVAKVVNQPPNWWDLFLIGLVQNFPVALILLAFDLMRNRLNKETKIQSSSCTILGIYKSKFSWDKNAKVMIKTTQVNFWGYSRDKVTHI